jgi:3-phenylpropionate/trans-cinnamate dioxygenase ferredoxin subunit
MEDTSDMTKTFFDVCAIDDLLLDERLFIQLGEVPVVIMNVDGEYFAIEDVCTHDDGPLGEGEIEEDEIICPRHGARFNLRTGEVLSLPAVMGVKTYPIKIEGDRILIGVEE